MDQPFDTITRSQRIAVILSALLALFLGALDSLVVSAAMPTIVAELGGLHLYSWVYSAYFLSRAVSLPIFGKLADLVKVRTLLTTAIAVFVVASIGAGCAPDMVSLIAARVLQGVGAGGIFALVYIVLADVSPEKDRGRALSLGSSIWGIASVLGPTLGGVIVSYFSWRWIFFINVPLGLASFWGIGAFLVEFRQKKNTVELDLLGVATLSTAILAFLTAFLVGGRSYPWGSKEIVGLFVLSLVGLAGFVWAEHRAKDPILSIGFFRMRGFSIGNSSVFLSSFAIFSLFAYAPLFIQGVQGKTPLEVGVAMLSLSLGWSVGSLALGQVIHRLGRKMSALSGAGLLLSGSAMTLIFSPSTTMTYAFITFFIVGIGMGFVALSTLLVVQSCLDNRDLGVATASHQFARTLGGAVGVGVCGSFVSSRIDELAETISSLGILDGLPPKLAEGGIGQMERLMGPEVRSMLPPELLILIQDSVGRGVSGVFWTVSLSSLLCLALCALLPGEGKKA